MPQPIVFITGTSSGIGRALAEVLVERRYQVFGSSRQGSVGAPAGVEQLTLDVRDDASVRAAVSQVCEKAGRIDVLINNAGVVQLGAVEELTIEDVRANFETNLFGVVRVTRAVLPIMREQRAGQIINIGSTAGRFASPFFFSYCGSKFALEAFTQALRLEVRPFNIHVSLLGPSFVKSGIPEREGPAPALLADYAAGRDAFYSRYHDELSRGADTITVAREMSKVVGLKRPRARYAIGKAARQLEWLSWVTPKALVDIVTMKYWGLDQAYTATHQSPKSDIKKIGPAGAGG